MKSKFKVTIGFILIVVVCGGCSGRVQNTDENEFTMIQIFMESDVSVFPAIGEYNFRTDKDKGLMRELRGVLPCVAEGFWYIVLIDGVEYYYAKYDPKDSEKADYFGYAIFSNEYSLQNGKRPPWHVLCQGGRGSALCFS